MRKTTTFDVFKERAVGLDWYLDAEKQEQYAQEQYERVCAIGYWMFFLGFPQYSFPEDDERQAHSQLVNHVVRVSLKPVR